MFPARIQHKLTENVCHFLKKTVSPIAAELRFLKSKCSLILQVAELQSKFSSQPHMVHSVKLRALPDI